MKKIYLALSILLVGSQITLAQLSLTKAFNEPIIGDVNNKQKYDTTTAIPKNTGANQMWNFTSLALNSYSEASTYMAPASTPSASSFPGATISEQQGTGGSYTHYKSTTTNFEYQGIQFPGVVINFTNTGIAATWPVNMGYSVTDPFGGSNTTGTVTSSINGSINVQGSGTGTVVMPGGLTLTNCLQVKNTITFTLTQNSSTQTQIQTEYSYYHSSSKFPVLSAQYQVSTTGTVTSTQLDIFVNKAIVAGIKEQQVSASNSVVFPNPAKDLVNVVLPNNEVAAQLQIVDVTGKVMTQTTNANSINVSSLAKGVYFVRITSKGAILQKQIVLVD